MGVQPRIVIVDDNPHVIALLVRALHRHDYPDVTTAATVDQALDLFTTSLPDVVLLDLSLSVQDEHTLLRHLRRAPHWSTLPVLMITGPHPATAIQAASHEGASGFIPQPLDGTEITYKIQEAIRARATHAAEVTDLMQADTATDLQTPPPRGRTHLTLQ